MASNITPPDLQNIIKNLKLAPSFMLGGITYMLSKKPDAYSPWDFGPMVCLSTIYKLLTNAVFDEIYAHYEQNNILTEE